jgi:hypothetical protein
MKWLACLLVALVGVIALAWLLRVSRYRAELKQLDEKVNKVWSDHEKRMALPPFENLRDKVENDTRQEIEEIGKTVNLSKEDTDKIFEIELECKKNSINISHEIRGIQRQQMLLQYFDERDAKLEQYLGKQRFLEYKDGLLRLETEKLQREGIIE